ncbi:M10 family metallopeptidase C-terminal domain-containing protein [Pseudaestuariivita atlantica]|uniref:Peptidase M10 serralysin C-terminal domain-containing protein n=1 Tax=Pseudaestuariivita atlantica TaxID=1317121 RepID=A0A0L1JKI8_9RHOB|nr:M10 family metallopeptidase C-terminal domain-containing protein [Pseudaestuariivita atlantica]KNG92232.1 hypothetical protein ATO11_18415 [Pseudaestuariivita atlantica]
MEIAYRALLPRGIFEQSSPTTDLEIVTLGGETFLVVADSWVNGVSLYRVTAGGAVQLADQQTHARNTGVFSGVDITQTTYGGEDRVLVALNGLDGVQRHVLDGTGGGGLPGQAEQVSFAGQVARDAHTVTAWGDYVYVGHEEGGISVYEGNASGALTYRQTVGTGLNHVDALVAFDRGAQPYVVSASASGNEVTLWRITSDGRLQAADVVGPQEGLGADTPTALEAVTVGGATYVIVGAAGSSTLSVLEVRGNGTFALTDHVLDDRGSRFGDVATIATVERDGQVFVAAGGPDDGVSLFLLAPGGLLVPLAHAEDTLDAPLQNVVSVELAAHDDGLTLFAASETEPGVGFFDVDLTGFGGVFTDTDLDDALVGTGQADILFAGEGADTLTGGAGADTFVILPGEDRDRIADYRINADVIDLSFIPLVHSLADVQVVPTANGARVTVRGLEFDVINALGGSLDADDITFSYGPAHYVYPLTDPDGGSSGGGSGGGGSGGGGSGGGGSGGGGSGGSGGGGGGSGGGSGGGTGDGDTITGTENRDVLSGGPRGDMIYGLGGNDVLMAGEGGDMHDGGDGNDTVDFSQVAGRVLVDLKFDVSTASFARFFQYGDVAGDAYVSIERFVGGDYADNLRGSDGNDRLVGGGRSDRLYGRAGNDRLEGGAGTDALYGNRGADTMIGGDDAGRRDRFIYFNVNESEPGDNRRDEILDFVPGEDRIEISRFDADITQGGKQRFDFIGQDAFSGTAGELRAAWDAGAGMTLVQADLDGDGDADFEIGLWGNLTLSAGDFLL